MDSSTYRPTAKDAPVDRPSVARAGIPCIVAATGLPLVCMPAMAQETEPRFEITPHVAWRGGGSFSDQDTDAGFDLQESSAWGLTINGAVSQNTQWEVFYARQSTDAAPTRTLSGATPFDMDIEYLHVGGTYLFEGAKVQPFIALTIGASRFDPQPDGFDGQTFLSGSFGGGVKFDLARNLGVRLEARGYGTLVDKDNRLFCESDAGLGTCLIVIDGTFLSQWEVRAGLTLGFD